MSVMLPGVGGRELVHTTVAARRWMGPHRRGTADGERVGCGRRDPALGDALTPRPFGLTGLTDECVAVSAIACRAWTCVSAV